MTEQDDIVHLLTITPGGRPGTAVCGTHPWWHGITESEHLEKVTCELCKATDEHKAKLAEVSDG